LIPREADGAGTGLRTGELSSRILTVTSNARPLRVALAWSDTPGPTIVNNLNLIVTAPDGRKFVGNQRRNGPPTFDRTNNVELVHVEKPAAGTWTADVVGSNVRVGRRTSRSSRSRTSEAAGPCGHDGRTATGRVRPPGRPSGYRR
jgi:hypothetical protein